MTGPALSVPVQWALHGKGPEGEGYRVLSCSTGDLSRANFTDAIDRFTVGVVDTLPQVSLSYVQPAASPSSGYLALAIDWSAGDGQRYASGVAPVDALGRRTQFTSYFCAPYRVLAEKLITYRDMYEAFSAVPLPETDGSPKTLTITPSPRAISVSNELAIYVAPLLLTGTPVCVLGAEETSLQERLRFIDTVMELLPYGFRSRMTAATWVRTTLRDHRFRLFFSNARRTDQDDHVVTWGEPELIQLPRQAKDYFDWLEDKVAPLTRLTALSELSSDLKFDKTALTKTLELVDLGARRHLPTRAQLRPLPGRARDHEPEQLTTILKRLSDGAALRRLPEPATSMAVDEIADMLPECAEYVRDKNLPRLRSTTNWLARRAETDSELQQRAVADESLREQAEAVESRRKHYREQIKEHGLLQPHGLGSREKDLHAALLAVAFGRPLTYAGFCQVEDCLSELPHLPLLYVIKDGEMAFDTKAIVLFLTKERGEKELNKWYASGEIDPAVLIQRLAQDWKRPHHARVICDLLIDYLRKMPTGYDRARLRTALRQHGFLAHAFHLRHPGKEQYQIYVLFELIRAAYQGFPVSRREAIDEILTRTAHPPTPALLAALLMNLSNVGDIQHAREAYVRGSLTLMETHPTTQRKLDALVPAPDPAASVSPEPGPGAGPPRPDDPTETILLECISQALAKDIAQLPDSVTALRVYGSRAANPLRYRQIITEHQLLQKTDLGLGSLANQFYDAMLRLAFATPLDYQEYCRLADCLTPAGASEPRPPDALLLAIDRAANAGVKSAGVKGGGADLRVSAIVAAYLESAQRDAKSRPRHLDAARSADARFRSGQLDAVRLIEALADTWERPHHAKLVLGVLTSHLIAARGRTADRDRQAIIGALKAHGHLAPALRSRYPDSEPDQIAALAQLLDAAYPGKLDGPTAWDILAPEARTDALLTVVSGKTDDPKVKARITKLIRDRDHGPPGDGEARA